MSILLNTIADLYRHSPHLRVVPLAVIALGSNLSGPNGSPQDNLKAVLPALQLLSTSPLLVSDTVVTEPVDCPPGSPPFANAVAVLCPENGVSPVELLLALQSVETSFGRSRKGVRNEARIIDLDLISFGEQRIESERLILPHPRATQRLFVLQPLLQIWPDFIFPRDSLTVKEHISILLRGA
jgi:2-amino-4-hydroxy-6-hydroxymethyldihydropteridine diphosphokinase